MKNACNMIKQLNQKFEHYSDKRSPYQKVIAKMLVERVTEENYQRICHYKAKALYDAERTFITFSGSPPMQQQYKLLKFPGKVIHFDMPGFEKDFQKIYDTQQKVKTYLQNISLASTIEKIKQIIERQVKGGSAFLVAHSFGSFIASSFCVKYPQKVKGFICIGGPVLTYYPVFQTAAKVSLQMGQLINKQNLIQNYDMLFQVYRQQIKKNPEMAQYKNKFHFAALMLQLLPQNIKQIYINVKKVPQILICHVYGRKDKVLTPQLCQAFSSYLGFLKGQGDKKQYWKSLKDAFSRMNQQNTGQLERTGLQSKFIFSIAQAPHGIHYSPRFFHKVQTIIDSYIDLIIENQKDQVPIMPKL